MARDGGVHDGETTKKSTATDVGARHAGGAHLGLRPIMTQKDGRVYDDVQCGARLARLVHVDEVVSLITIVARDGGVHDRLVGVGASPARLVHVDEAVGLRTVVTKDGGLLDGESK